MRSLDRLRQSYDEDSQVVVQDRKSPPRLIFSDSEILLEELPVGTRVVFPNPPIEPLANWRAAIRWAINHPEGCDPLHAKLRPGMKVLVAMDDISLPLPPMRTPDVRQIMLEIVLNLLADSGVDDVHLIIANALHRRMTPQEMRRMVGDKIFDGYYPDRYTNHDAEEPGGIVELGETEAREKVRISRKATEADLVIYLNVNFVPMDGGHKSVGTGLTDYLGLRAHHTPHAIRESKSYMEPRHSALHGSVNRIGRIIDEHVDVFHIETCLNNQMYDGPLGFLGKREEDFTDFDRTALAGLRWTLSKTPRALRQQIFHRVPAAYGLIAVAAGRTEPAHEKILEACRKQSFVRVRGQSDILICGIPYISPYNVNSVLNPLLVQVMACGYFFNMNRGVPLVKKGGTLILTHPCMDEFDPVQHPSYIEFFHRLLPETTDAMALHMKYEREFAQNPSYVHLYRKGNAYHGAHPFYMWYWGENGRAHLGQIIAVGTENQHVPKLLGWERSDTLAEAIAMARGTMGRSASITMLHHPPILISDVR
ncbi:MAG: lactate racemase domain-containing protein [Myxococcales bacterium]